MKTILNLLGVAFASACVGIHPSTTSLLFQCGDLPPSFVNEQGQSVTQVSNFTITKVGNLLPLRTSYVSVKYEGFRSEAIILEDNESSFRYQFNNADGELVEIFGSPSEGKMTLLFPNTDNSTIRCNRTKFNREL